MKLFPTDAGNPSSSLDIRDTLAHNGVAIRLGADGYSSGIVTLENTLDQSVSVDVQGMGDETGTWRGAAQVVEIPAGEDVVVCVPTAFQMIRLVATCSIAPTTGTLSAGLARSRGGGLTRIRLGLERIATVANGDSQSEVIDGTLHAAMDVHIPAGFDAGWRLGIVQYSSVDGAFHLKRDDVNTVLMITPTPGDIHSFPTAWFGTGLFKLQILTAGGVVQTNTTGTDLVFGLTLKS